MSVRRGARRQRIIIFDSENKAEQMRHIEVDSIQPHQTELSDGAKAALSIAGQRAAYVSSSFDARGLWRLNDGGNLEQYEESDDVGLERSRFNAGQLASAEISVEMKKDGGVLGESSPITDQQFDELNSIAEPVWSALTKGQFITALQRWRSIFGADSINVYVVAFRQTAEFAALDSSVSSIIGARILSFDGKTQAFIDAL